MSDSKTIVCKPSQWFKVRAIAVMIMLLFFSLWFFKDGYWTYRDKNAEVVIQQIFLEKGDSAIKDADFVVKAIDEFNKQEYTPESWAAFAKEQKISTPESKNILPRDFDYSRKWPEEIVNGYDQLKKSEMFPLWKAYSQRTGLDIKPNDKIFNEDDIKTQLIICGVTIVLFLISVFSSLRIMGRSMKVTATGYSPPGGSEIPFSAMRKIDKRKWRGKGLATIYYEEAGVTRKAKVDGMVYGHFKEEDGVPAEALFSQIMENFKGEVVDFIDEEEETEQKEDDLK
jgi:hypothetical protein